MRFRTTRNSASIAYGPGSSTTTYHSHHNFVGARRRLGGGVRGSARCRHPRSPRKMRCLVCRKSRSTSFPACGTSVYLAERHRHAPSREISPRRAASQGAGTCRNGRHRSARAGGTRERQLSEWIRENDRRHNGMQAVSRHGKRCTRGFVREGARTAGSQRNWVDAALRLTDAPTFA